MLKKFYLLPVLLLTLVIVSCDETEEVSKYSNWKERNEAFVDSLQQVYDAKTDRELLAVTDTWNKNQTIFFKKLPGYPATSEKKPILTSTVSVFYKGMLIDEAVFSRVSSPKYYTRSYEDLTVFDSNFKDPDPTVHDNPYVTPVTGVISGWVEILQHMQVGERWEVYIPYGSGYGAAAQGSNIPAYSTLIFDMQLVEITEY